MGQSNVKVRVIDFEMDGSDEVVTKAIGDLAAAFTGSPNRASNLAGAEKPIEGNSTAALPAPPMPEVSPHDAPRAPRKIQGLSVNPAKTPAAGDKLLCPYCGDLFVLNRSGRHQKKTCHKQECKRKRVRDYQHRWAMKKRKQSGDSPAPTDTSIAQSMRGHGEEYALLAYARLHGGRLFLPEAVSELSASGEFGAGNGTAVRNKALALLEKMPGFSLNTLGDQPIWELTD